MSVKDVTPASRRRFTHHLAAGLATAGSLLVSPNTVFADSTGKYSTKATAKKRYLPRINKVISEFETLKAEVQAGRLDKAGDFFTQTVPDGVKAMDLYGSAMKRGELPDKFSKALQADASLFEKQVQDIAKAVAAKDQSKATSLLSSAEETLAQFLRGAELEPLGSASYKL